MLLLFHPLQMYTRTIQDGGTDVTFDETLSFNLDCQPTDLVHIKAKHDSKFVDTTIGESRQQQEPPPPQQQPEQLKQEQEQSSSGGSGVDGSVPSSDKRPSLLTLTLTLLRLFLSTSVHLFVCRLNFRCVHDDDRQFHSAPGPTAQDSAR